MRYKLLALDLDGTALGSDPRRFAPGVLQAAAQAAGAGCVVVIATGRSFLTLPPAIAAGQLPWLRYVILYDGAEILDLHIHACLWRQAIPAQGLNAAARIAQEHGVTVEYVAAGGAYYVSADGWEQLWQLPFTPFHRRVLERCAQPFTGPASALAAQDILKLNLLCLTPAGQDSIFQALHRAGLLAMECAPGALEVTSPAAGKLEAVRFLAGRLGLPLDKVMALGDSGNDAALLAGAGLGVAMGNAPDFVKLAAKAVTASNVEGGAAQAIRRWLLEEA